MLPIKILQADQNGQAIDVGPATGFVTAELVVDGSTWKAITVPAGLTVIYLAAKLESGGEWKFSSQSDGTGKITIPVSNGFEIYAAAGTVVGYAQAGGADVLELMWSTK